MLNDTYKKIGERVKHHRTNRGLSQDQLADGICSRQTISLLENGQHFPSAEFMKQIAAKLSVPFHEIMVDEAKELEAKVQLDIIKVYVEIGDYANAFPLIEELEQREDLLEYQRRELVLSKAECLIRTSKASQAVDLLTDLQQRLELDRETDDHFMAALYDKLGTANYFLSSITNAHAHYMRAYQLTLRFPTADLTAARISYNLGMACRQLNRHSEAIEYLTFAENFFKKASDPKRLALTYLELGIAHQFGQQYEIAASYLKQSLNIYQAINMVNMSRQVRRIYASRVLSHTNPDKAIQELKACIVEYEQAGDTVRIVYTYAHLANVLMTQKKLQEAEESLQVALNIITRMCDINDPRVAYVYYVNALYLFEIQSFGSCIEYSFKSTELFDKMGYEVEAADSLNLAAKVYRIQGMLEQAYDLIERVNTMLRRTQNRNTWRLEGL